MSNNIKVVCRFRPPNAVELSVTNGESIVSIDSSGTTVQLKSLDGRKGEDANGFTFDRAFQMETQQVEVFEYGIKSIVTDVLDGYNGTVFAYGQSGSGKTHTMMGPDIDDAELKGIIPRITEQIFASIMASPADLEYLVKVSYMEIYMERIRDLMLPANDNLPIHEDKTRGVYVKNLSDYYVGNADEVYEIMRQGGNARATSSTNMNSESSRSHSIFVITIQQRHTETGTQKMGSLYLVDLAGSEKIGKTGASGQTLEEAKKINKSLSALGMVINALTDGKSAHIPYRDSKLTRILQESLGGNSRTTLIINCSPSSYNEAETLSTLRFGMRAKSIKNKARVNAELSATELKALLKKAQRDQLNFQGYIGLLEREIAIWREGGHVSQQDWNSMETALGLSVGDLEALIGAGACTKINLDSKWNVNANTTAGSRAPTPSTPSRSYTPSSARLADDANGSITPGLDEREEFLRRENELTDQLAKTESSLVVTERLLRELQAEVSSNKQHERVAISENKSMSIQLNEVRAQVEKVIYEKKEAGINLDALKAQNVELTNELNAFKRSVDDLKASTRATLDSQREKLRAERMAEMMATFDPEPFDQLESALQLALSSSSVVSESPELDLRPNSIISTTRFASLKTQLETLVERELLSSERIRVVEAEREQEKRRREEGERRCRELEGELEGLLDRSMEHDDSSVEIQDIKIGIEIHKFTNEINDLKSEVELKSGENGRLNREVEHLKALRDELERAFKITTAGIEGGQDLAIAAQEMERVRRTLVEQLKEFDTMKKSLLKDLQNRCEKVIELEISLDEIQEQYKTVVKSSGTKATARKMDFLMRNLDQLGLVQKQLVEQNSTLKKDVAIAERKLLARNERIANLEILLSDAQDEIHASERRFEERYEAVRKGLSKGVDSSTTFNSNATLGTVLNFGRIAKPIKGGGGREPESRLSSSSFFRPSSYFGSSVASTTDR